MFHAKGECVKSCFVCRDQRMDGLSYAVSLTPKQTIKLNERIIWTPGASWTC
jgi:hypothetical protein